MAESRDAQIRRLLAEGLELYGVDDTGKAILTWERVLELDPRNSEAIDYIKSADRRRHPRPSRPRRPGQETIGAVSALLDEARLLMSQDQYVAAYDLLKSASGPGFATLEFEATVDLIRSRLYRFYCERVVDLQRIPELKSDAGSLKQFNLPANAGFLLSMVDGMTPVADLISVSGMDAFETLYTLNQLLDAGIVGLSI